jgi:farnesyl-diphosphate farnesyltransferase
MSHGFFQSEAATTILKNVSRSFYLSLRLLPEGMRDGASLGYLLARSSDTIADTASVSVADRITLLDDYERSVQNGEPFIAPDFLLTACTDAEKVLLEQAPGIFSWLQQMDAPVQELVREVLHTIISGQKLDLQRFGNASAAQHMELKDDAELLDYCYRVAGCVGEFWTKLGFYSEGPNFSREPLAVMMPWAKHFGQALQLVNILRDLPEDLRAGRFYLPHTSSVSIGEDMLVQHRRWLQQARHLLADGILYSDALRGRKLRAATVLPALLADETIDKLVSATWQQLEQRVKVPRSTVFRCLAEAMLF